MLLYFDVSSGIAGDMLVASLVDAGVDFEYVRSGVISLGLDVELELKEKLVNGIRTKRFIVERKSEHHCHRSLRDIMEIIDRSDLPESVKELSYRIFERIAQAEAKVHGVALEEVEFHEIGADDSIVDIVAFSLCMEYLKPEEVYFSPLFDGKGFVKSMHGLIPVPAPAVLEVARIGAVPIGTIDIDTELITPTGIGIASVVSKGFTPMPYMRIKSIGYASGAKDLSIPNVLRAIIGEKVEPKEDWFEVFANIDDMTGEEMALALEKVMGSGAVDVYFTPIYMKKGRPAYKLGAIVPSKALDEVVEAIFRWTSTIGVRIIPLKKIEMEREFRKVQEDPEIRVKVSSFKDIRKLKVEFEDLKRIT